MQCQVHMTPAIIAKVDQKVTARGYYLQRLGNGLRVMSKQPICHSSLVAEVVVDNATGRMAMRSIYSDRLNAVEENRWWHLTELLPRLRSVLDEADEMRRGSTSFAWVTP
jgi:hypothetical protein